MPGLGFPNLPPPFTLPPTPFRPVDVHGTPQAGGQSSASLPLGKSWYVRVGGSNNNGGSDASLAALRTGTDGVLNSTTTFTSASAAFTQADVGRGICINTGGSARHHKIVTVNSGTNVTLDRVAAQSASGLTWAIGGAWADWRAANGDTAANVDTNSPLVAGDICYVGAGTYRVTTSAGANWNPKAPGVTFSGDTTGSFTGDAGQVQITAYLAGDSVAPTGSFLWLTGTVGPPSNLNFANFLFVAGTQTIFLLQSARAYSWFNCGFITQAGSAIQYGGAGANNNQSLDSTVDRCQFFGTAPASDFISLTPTSSGARPVDLNVLVQNTSFLGLLSNNTHAINLTAAAGAGLTVRNCQILLPSGGIRVSNNIASVATVTGCVFMGGAATACLTAQVLGQITENYNLFLGSQARLNVAAGPNSKTVGAALMHFGQERIWGAVQRAFGEPMQVSPIRAFGAANTAAGPLDVRGIPRPSSQSQWDVGAFQRGNTAVQTTTVVQAGSSAIQIIGNGTQDFDVPVNATATALSIWIRYDSNYTGPLPQIQVVKAQQVGVGDYTVPVSKNSLNAYAQYTIPLINPTANGIVTLRIVSGDTSGAGNVYADAFAVS